MDKKIALNPNAVVAALRKTPETFTREDIINFVVDHGIKMIDFMYPAEDGRVKTLNFVINDLEYLETILLEGERVDGSSLFPSFVQPGSSDLYVVPRYRTAFVDPFQEIPTLVMLCSFFDKDGQPFECDPAQTLARAEEAFPGRIDPDDPRFANPADMASEICAALEMPGQAGHDEGRQAENDEGRQAALDEARHPRLDRGSLSDAQIVSCIYHSLADRYAEVLEQLRGFAPFPIERLHIIGGGSANALLDQWTADATGIPVVAGPTEATAIGNLMLQARAAGLAADRRQMRRIIAEAFSVKTFYPKQSQNPDE